MSSHHRLPLLLAPAFALLLTLFALPAMAVDRCSSSRMDDTPPAVNFRVDNDLLGGKEQDQGYTNGAQLTFVSPNLNDYVDDPCLPRLARWINRYLERLQPGRFEQQNMVFSIAQGLFTPVDYTRSDLIEGDRPYAAVLLASFGYNARNESRLDTTQLQLGTVGPAALGRQVQDLVHQVTGSEAFMGWEHQLHNEPVLRLVHERMRRWPGNDSFDADGWAWDAIAHWGGALGNLSTHANAGMEVRFGWKLPDDFGSTPLRPAGENTAPPIRGRGRGWSAHVFLTSDVRWVLHDITLDGNTFRHSHRVDRRPLVGDAGYGLAVMYGHWKFALARYHRSREFEEQKDPPVFGSFTVSRML
ncbi:MAG: lipid A deacylase LpxR family protein [Pseudoxanthomonas sp.]|nr:lipid A deacylase LpxR family protein [Pseudoxanthomonas sp.]